MVSAEGQWAPGRRFSQSLVFSIALEPWRWSGVPAACLVLRPVLLGLPGWETGRGRPQEARSGPGWAAAPGLCGCTETVRPLGRCLVL